MKTHDAQVMGESARAISDLIRSFPISVSTTGRVIVDTSTADDAPAFARAYERMELVVMTGEMHCTEHEAHATVDELEFKHIVLVELMARAKRALGASDRPDALWMH